MQKFGDGGKYFTGNRCERGIGKAKREEREAANIYDYKYKRLFDYYEPLTGSAAPRGKIGLPRALNMYEEYTCWFTVFTQRGYEVVLSDPLLSGEARARAYHGSRGKGHREDFLPVHTL